MKNFLVVAMCNNNFIGIKQEIKGNADVMNEKFETRIKSMYEKYVEEHPCTKCNWHTEFSPADIGLCWCINFQRAVRKNFHCYSWVELDEGGDCITFAKEHSCIKCGYYHNADPPADGRCALIDRVVPRDFHCSDWIEP